MRPRCFSKAILYYGAPLPSTGSARAAFPGVISTIRALRLPVLSTELLMFFASPAPTDPLLVRSHAAGEIRRAWSRSSPVPLAIFRLVTHRSSQVPGESIPYLCPVLGSRPVHRTSPYRPNNAAPTLRTVKALTSRICRDSITQLRYPLPTLQVVRYRTRMQGSLPAGG
jgi:hypothetical protein